MRSCRQPPIQVVFQVFIPLPGLVIARYMTHEYKQPWLGVWALEVSLGGHDMMHDEIKPTLPIFEQACWAHSYRNLAADVPTLSDGSLRCAV